MPPISPALLKEIRQKWKPRNLRSHKGDFGRVFVMAGSEGYTGAARLAGMGAMRSGAGLVTVGVPRAVYPIVASGEWEVMVKPFASTPEGAFSYNAAKPLLNFLKTQDVFALGPGLSRQPGTQRLIRRLIAQCPLPMVVDADALNALEDNAKLLKACSGRAVLTPHPGEFGRVFGSVPSSSAKERLKMAAEAARKYGVIILLKGNRTVVASPDGRTFVNMTGNPGMATGGTGDILTGMIAALAGQRLSLYDAARFAVYFHGLAGDLALLKKGEAGLIATDLLDFLPSAFLRILKR